ncbi:hypothetical protein [Paenibacillus sp. GCM10012306]|uniref:RNA dependent RNA polymerase n=1 Tax=Paenibacillus sp. GCM10012306 TaxID=3317342 RepID=UPI003612648C
MIYSVDTSAFYNDKEKRIQDLMNRGQLKKNLLVEKRKKLDKKNDLYLEIYTELTLKIKHYNKRNNQLKERIKYEFNFNESIRNLRESYIADKNIVSVFDSVLTRVLKINPNTITTDIIIVQAYFFSILEDLIKDGFMLHGEKYICFTASAGQIRTKKTVFIKETIFQRYCNTLMCGLSVDRINEHGGINVNKYLAYLALCNSATEQWKDFDIKKCIVVEDFNSLVNSEVDFISDLTYEVERKIMDIPIEHTDGCGMILPRKSKKPFMVRGPWIKGLLMPFPFDKFIREHNKVAKYSKYGIVEDIYGITHDILKDKIEVIFTKSQFKMWKFFASWKEYQDLFIQHNCQAGKCNEEEERIKKAKINYQMLQSLVDTSDEELLKLCIPSISMIEKAGSDKKTMLEILGVTEFNTKKNYFQQALEIYPELLKDEYSKEVLKETRRKMIKNAKSGKLRIDGKYTFISPDLYAFCEKLILKSENPIGLLNNNEVYCSLYKDNVLLDCLRSPHLYREHALRRNTVNEEKKRWFVTKSLYTSCHDPISKLLQFDCDGDKALVCQDETLVEVAARNMKGIVPLYYEMKKADPEILTTESIYNGLNSAYMGGNIGTISNNISKVWNSEEFELDVIKKLCMENNFTIDFAKTLYKPKRPKEVSENIKKYTSKKVPFFFIYAKDKDDDEVEKINNSVVNRIGRIIPKKRLNFKAANVGHFDYRVLMSGKSHEDHSELKEKIIETYIKNDKNKRFIEFKPIEDDMTGDNLYPYKVIRDEHLKITDDLSYIVDILVDYLYDQKKSKYKATLWSSFGDMIIKNINSNLRDGTMQCESCGERVVITGNRMRYCKACAERNKRERTKERVRNYRSKNNYI